MKRIIVLIVTFALLTGILAGCTGTSPDSGPAKEEAAWPRTIEDAVGNKITLEKKPERIAVLDFGYIETLLALDITPIASVYAERSLKGFGTLQPYADEVQIEELGEAKSPNLEKLVELEPDLILYTAEAENMDMELYEAASQIAPVVTFDSPDWKTQLRDFGECLGKEEKAEAYISEIEDMIAQSREDLSAYSNKTVALMFERASDVGNFYISGSEENPVWFDSEEGIGLTPPSGYPKTGQLISLEGLAEMNPDYIFLFGTIQSEAEGYGQSYLSKETQASSVWQSLTAVKNGNVYYLDAAVRAAGVLSIKVGLENIVESAAK